MYDLAVIGGGINGCGIARDAALRGLSVVLFEKGDLASGTSSGSTKLIHGGLRYLEHYEFRLVHKALVERELLWSIAPHVIWPLRFILPHHPSLRPKWAIRLALALYDHMGGRKRLPASSSVRFASHPAGNALISDYTHGFEYSDCWVDDARLVVLNARDAQHFGADIRTRTEVTNIHSEDQIWQIDTVNAESGTSEMTRARYVVNAAGPWVADVVDRGPGAKERLPGVRLVKGSHIVVPRLFDHDFAYLLQNDDKRIVFAIPYEDDFTLVGTTDVDITNDPGASAPSNSEIEYLCECINGYFQRKTTPADVVWQYAAVRPLFDDGASAAQEATRDYVLEHETLNGAPISHIFGGKITTYRQLARECVDTLSAQFAHAGPCVTERPLPGGDFPVDAASDLLGELKARYSFLEDSLLHRYARSYGRDTFAMLGNVTSAEHLGSDFGHGLFAREVEWLIDREWARTAEDVLWRRTKLGLRLNDMQRAALGQWMAERPDAKSPA